MRWGEVYSLLNNALQLTLFRFPSRPHQNWPKPWGHQVPYGTLWYPLPLTSFPKPLQPLPFTYEAVPPGFKDSVVPAFFFKDSLESEPHFWHLNPSIEEAYEAWSRKSRPGLTHRSVNLPSPPSSPSSCWVNTRLVFHIKIYNADKVSEKPSTRIETSNRWCSSALWYRWINRITCKFRCSDGSVQNGINRVLFFCHKHWMSSVYFKKFAKTE